MDSNIAILNERSGVSFDYGSMMPKIPVLSKEEEVPFMNFLFFLASSEFPTLAKVGNF
jgi:hypothetical protein